MRLKYFICIWSVFYILFHNPVQAGTLHDWTLSLIKKKGLKAEDFALYSASVQNPESNSTLNHRGEILMLPASITKLLTTSAAIEYLELGTRLKTKLVSNGKIQGSKLIGDLFLVGGGDPTFVSENMWILVNHFTRTGITEIEGDLIVDDSLFDRIRFDESRESVRVDRAYDAPVGAMSFNWNSVNVYVRATTSGQPAKVILDPESEYFKLVSSVKTKSSGIPSIDVERKWDEKSKKEIVEVRGSIPEQVKEHVVFANITNPDYWSALNLKSFLNQRGIRLKGDLQVGKVAPNSGILLAESESKPLESILSDMNKFSNNFVAEMLTKLMSVQKQKPGSLKNGVTLIRDHLKKLGFTDNDFSIVNPSGLTRENRMTAKALWRLLEIHEKDFSSMPELLVSLPTSGVDGTLKRRMKNGTMNRMVRAKTGLLNGVVSLAGYLSGPNGEPRPFVFIYNGPGDSAVVRETMDQILERIYSQR